MNKKIGIVTFHNALSFGAVLQSYAMQQFLLKNDIDNEIVDYQCDYMNQNYKKLIRVVKGMRIKSFIGSMLQYKNKKRSIMLSERFQNSFYKKTASVNRDNIGKLSEQFTAFIAGSDQVWSPTCVGFDKTYFLDFAKPEQKYSYAASFGTSQIPDDKVEEYKKLLKDFKHYSVREKSGADIVKSITGKESEINIDPTLLLTAKEWDKVAADTKIKQPYIFLFNVLKPKHMIEYAVKLGQEKNMPVYYLNDKHIPINGINYIDPVSADEFVGLIKNAEYVVTNSFHGSAFSIIYHKKLIMELDTATRRNNRSEELLKQLGINNIEIGEVLNPNPDEKIDWENVERYLEEQRKKSQNYVVSI